MPKLPDFAIVLKLSLSCWKSLVIGRTLYVPGTVKALGVPLREAEADLMGKWRHLRNWLVHPATGGDA